MSNHYTKIISKAVLIAAWCLWFRVLFAPRPASCRVHGCPACSGGGKCPTCDVPRARKRVCQQLLLNSTATVQWGELLMFFVCFDGLPVVIYCQVMGARIGRNLCSSLRKQDRIFQKLMEVSWNASRKPERLIVEGTVFFGLFQLIFVWIFSHESWAEFRLSNGWHASCFDL